MFAFHAAALSGVHTFCAKSGHWLEPNGRHWMVLPNYDSISLDDWEDFDVSLVLYTARAVNAKNHNLFRCAVSKFRLCLSPRTALWSTPARQTDTSVCWKPSTIPFWPLPERTAASWSMLRY